MNPLALGLPLAIPTLNAASHVAAGGLGFLKSLLAPESPNSKPAAPSTDPEIANLQRAVAQELQRGGLGSSLPLVVSDAGSNGLSVPSGTRDRAAVEQRLNANPLIVEQFRSLAQRAGTLFRLVIPSTSGLDTSA
jgi:hypothetical protein